MIQFSLPFTCDAGTNNHRGSGVITYHNANDSNAASSGENFPALYIGSNSAQCYMGPTQWTATSGSAQSNRYFIGGELIIQLNRPFVMSLNWYAINLF